MESSSSSSSSSADAAPGTTTMAASRRRPVTRRCVRPPLRSPLPTNWWTERPKPLIYKKDRSPAGYDTAWEDIHSDCQLLLLQLEKRIFDYKDESKKLDQCSRLYEHAKCGDSFQFEVNEMKRDLAIPTFEIKVNVDVQSLTEQISVMCLNAKPAVRSYCMAISSLAPSNSCIQGRHVLDPYGLYPKRPSKFLQFTVSRFENCLKECYLMVDNLEEILIEASEKLSSKPRNSSVESLPAIMSDVYDFFVHIAAKVEWLHQCANSMRKAYLAERRRGGDASNPFFEADMRKLAEEEAATRSELLNGQGSELLLGQRL